MSFSFRIRLNLSPRAKLNIGASEVPLSTGRPKAGPVVVLRSVQSEMEIQDASQLLLLGHGYAGSNDAVAAARKWRAMVMAGFAAVYFGADFGDRAAKGAWTNHGLSMLAEQTGRVVLNDVHGTIVYETVPQPLFASTSARPVKGINEERVLKAIHQAVTFDYHLTARQELCYELFSASFFTEYADSRFLLLMMALETLIVQQPKGSAVAAHLEELKARTDASGLQDDEISSLRSSLEQLKQESVGKAGRRLANSLGDRRYKGESPSRFFTNCYQLRSELVHGSDPRPPRQEVDVRAGSLELFVADLLAGPLVDL